MIAFFIAINHQFVHFSSVYVQSLLGSERIQTQIASKRFLARMAAHVHDQRRFLRVPFTAHVAHERFLARVAAHVQRQMLFAHETFSATLVRASVRFFALVTHRVQFQVEIVPKLLPAQIAHVIGRALRLVHPVVTLNAGVGFVAYHTLGGFDWFG